MGVFVLILMSFFSFQLKGRAIEVGRGTLERIPSADLRRPRGSDPDVVIQVKDLNDTWFVGFCFLFLLSSIDD